MDARILVVAMMLAGCPRRADPIRIVEPVRVVVPVPVEKRPPAELSDPFCPTDLPTFVAPTDPQASSALTPDGERRLRALISDLVARDRAWRAWASSEASTPAGCVR